MTVKKLRCLNCKEYFDREIMIKVPAGNFHSHDCAVEYARNRSQALKVKKQRKDTIERKKALKTKSDWIKDAQKAVNEYVRVRDEKESCISCDKPASANANEWDAGHYRSVGSSPEMRFYTLNIHKQCKRCNNQLSGNIVEYRKRLVRTLGMDAVERIEHIKKPLKPSIEYLQRLTKLMRKKVRLYKKLRKSEAIE